MKLKMTKMKTDQTGDNMSIAIPIHSQTDIITNSSTTIYTYSDRSPAACKEMIDAIFVAFGIPKKCDDVFNVIALLNENEHYEYWLDSNGHEVDGDVYELINKVKEGKVDKPQWMYKAEKSRDHGGGSVMHISPKSPEYEEVAKRIARFLYSTESEESSS